MDMAVGQEIGISGEVREAGKDLQLGTQTRAVSGAVVLFICLLKLTLCISDNQE